MGCDNQTENYSKKYGKRHFNAAHAPVLLLVRLVRDVPSHGQRGGENKYRSEQQPKVSRRFVHSRFFRGVANEVGVTLMLK